ncbi:retroelement pol polyprotein-like [Gossypium australe]|uniref:Retroelement pol polyprotein-like n=1 Tax=Gossypium australe TaxID=47621 RepID=A0A5B6X4S5_9ROSI|nr:retroelement pol polyprotein-like [Gossypium australe]
MSGLMLPNFTSHRRRKFLHDARHYYWYEPFLFKHCAAKLFRNGPDFMGPSPPSSINLYIFVGIYYASKWVEFVALPTNNAKSVIKF